MSQVSFAKFNLDLLDHWHDVTAEVEGDSPPVTLVADDGLGELQISVEQLPGDKPNQLTSDHLRTMLRGFAEGHSLGTPRDIAVRDSLRPQLTANFDWDGDFLRVWYIAEKSQLAFLTYTCDKKAAFADELQEAEEMIRTLQFKH